MTSDLETIKAGWEASQRRLEGIRRLLSCCQQCGQDDGDYCDACCRRIARSLYEIFGEYKGDGESSI